MAKFENYNLKKDPESNSIKYYENKANKIEFNFQTNIVTILHDKEDTKIELNIHDVDKNPLHDGLWEITEIVYNCNNSPPLKIIRYIHGEHGYPKSKYINIFPRIKSPRERPPIRDPISPKRKRSSDYSKSPAENAKLRRTSTYKKRKESDQRLGIRNFWSLND